jgi:hypothetical protein
MKSDEFLFVWREGEGWDGRHLSDSNSLLLEEEIRKVVKEFWIWGRNWKFWWQLQRWDFGLNLREMHHEGRKASHGDENGTPWIGGKT